MVKEKSVHAGWRTTAKIFITLFIVSVLIGLMAYSRGNSINESLNNCYNNQDNYEYKCPAGTSRQCVNNEEYALTYNPTTQTAISCNSAEGDRATCSNSNSNTVTCGSNQIGVCIDSGLSWTYCDSGNKAICLDSSKWAVWNGNYAYSCSAGGTAQCNY